MAGSQSDWPEEEKVLRALIRSLKACMILTRERAEKIAGQDLDDLLLSYPESAHTIFDDCVDNAEEVLAWRAVVVAHVVGEAMSRYAKGRTAYDDPWIAWRNEPADEPAGEFVHSLKQEEFFLARVGYHIHTGPNISIPSSVPSDGDLQDIPGHLETEDAYTWRDWLDILGPPGRVALLYSASAGAKRDVDEEHSNSGTEVGRKIAELMDQVNAFQMPTIERLESIGAKVDALGAPNRFRAEEFLKDALGVEVYSSLCNDARTAALDAERRFRDGETLDWNSVTAELAKAFELQVRQQFVPLLAEFLGRNGIKVFPNYEPLPGPGDRKRWPIIKDGRAVSRLFLGEIEKSLDSPLPLLKEFGQVYGFDLVELRKLIFEMTQDRNTAAHETGMSFVDAWNLRDRWLGVNTRDGGIFGVLRPTNR